MDIRKLSIPQIQKFEASPTRPFRVSSTADGFGRPNLDGKTKILNGPTSAPSGARVQDGFKVIGPPSASKPHRTACTFSYGSTS